MDGGQIGQVIQNIIMNADQAMPMGGIISITLQNVLRAREKPFPPTWRQDATIGISVKDDGIGIPGHYPAEDLRSLFYDDKDKGSGLGLAASYSIIRNHGGMIRREIRNGKGQHFFRLSSRD